MGLPTIILVTFLALAYASISWTMFDPVSVAVSAPSRPAIRMFAQTLSWASWLVRAPDFSTDTASQGHRNDIAIRAADRTSRAENGLGPTQTSRHSVVGTTSP